MESPHGQVPENEGIKYKTEASFGGNNGGKGFLIDFARRNWVLAKNIAGQRPGTGETYGNPQF